jgi:hypothetical protein
MPRGLQPLLLWTLAAMMFFAGLLVMRRTQRARRPAMIALAALLLLGVMGVAGCNKSINTSSGTPAGTYPIVVTAASGSLTHTSTVMLTVQ